MKKIIIVTGASSGMGVCFAEQLAFESACFLEKAILLEKTNGSSKKVESLKESASDEIWLVARRVEGLEKTAESIKKAADSFEKESLAVRKGIAKHLYPSTKIVDMDISGKEGALKLQALLTLENENSKSYGGIKINILVNNAGFGSYGEFAKTDTMREMQMVDLDCTSLTGITGYALPFMSKGSRLINTASLASFLPLGNFAVYGACKAYVLSFTVAIAAELKERGIKVTALCPGSVSTEFANVASKGARVKVKHGLSPEKTVANCLRKSRNGKLYSMFAFKWKFKAFMSRFVGRYLGAWFTYKFCKRPSN